MRFLVDVQLPTKLAVWLRARGEDAVHVLDYDLGRAKDIDLWQLAQKEERILISKDEDFFILASRPTDSGREYSNQASPGDSEPAMGINHRSIQRRTSNRGTAIR